MSLKVVKLKFSVYTVKKDMFLNLRKYNEDIPQVKDPRVTRIQ